MLDRELLRLDMSLQAALALKSEKPLVVMMHYPPLFDMERDTPFTRLLEQYPVHTVVYGHLHGAGLRAGFTGEKAGIHFHLVSCDGLGFRLKEIPLAKQTEVC